MQVAKRGFSSNSRWLRHIAGRGKFGPAVTLSRGLLHSTNQPSSPEPSRRRRRGEPGKRGGVKRSSSPDLPLSASTRGSKANAPAPAPASSDADHPPVVPAAPALQGAHGPDTTHPQVPPLSQLVPLPPKGQPQFADAPFKLRPYQVEAIHTVIKEWREGGVNAQMVMLPTGCGKTVVFAALARYMAQHFVPHTAGTAVAAMGSATSETAPGPAEDAVAAGRISPGGAIFAAGSTTAGGSPSASSDSHVDAGDAAASGASEHSRAASLASGRLQRLLTGEPDPTDDVSAPTDNTSSSSSSLPGPQSTEFTADAQGGPGTAQAVNQQRASSTKKARGKPKVQRSSSGSSDSPASSSADGSDVDSSRGRKGRKQQEQEAAAVPPDAMRVLVLAHRHELLHQAEDKFRLMWGSEDLAVSWVKGNRKEFWGQVVVASVATAVNCIPALKDCNFSLVVVDEAHHSVASTYRSVLQGLGFIEEVTPPPKAEAKTEQSGGSPAGSFSAADSLDDAFDSDSDNAGRSSPKEQHMPLVRVLPDPNRLLLGFSATPYRMKVSESRHLYDIFSVTFTRSIADMIRAKYLADLQSQRVLTQTDLKGAVLGKNGDFVMNKLSQLVNSRSRNKLVLAAFLEHCTVEASEQDAGPSPQQLQLHEEVSRTRAASVRAALERRKRRYDDKQLKKLQEMLQMQLEGMGSQQLEVQQACGGSLEASTAPEHDDDPFWGEQDEHGELLALLQDEEEEEEEVATDMYPLPASVSPSALTGGLSMAGRRAVRKTIAFAVDIQHAEAMNAVFNAAGVLSSAVHSLMPWDVMKGELARFRAGELNVLFNVEVLTEGFDEPSIDAILMARPTASPGLYIQMLGRGLRVMPGKSSCLVLDFTDSGHLADKVVDLRVLLPEFDPLWAGAPQEEPEEKGPSRIDDDTGGGEMDLLERALDPRDLAWMQLGPHWVTSIFSGGNVWLVQVDGMGPKQRQSLGLSAPAQAVQMLQEQPAPGQQDRADDGDDDDDDELAEGGSLQDRYVVLHQVNTRKPDPTSWRVAYKPSGHTWTGLSKEDAFGAALDYIDLYIRQEQVKAVRSFRSWGTDKNRHRYLHLNSFKNDAQWRRTPASDKQLQKLKQLEISARVGLTKGEASDLISLHVSALATQEQRDQLEEELGPSQFADLPVPLLKDQAAATLGDL